MISQTQITRLLLAGLAPTIIIWLSACTSIDHAAACDHFLAQASSASAAHNYAGAQEALSKAAREAAVSNDAAQTPRVLREQAAAFLCQNNPRAAEAAARQLIKIYDSRSTKDMSSVGRDDLAEDRSRARLILSDALLDQKRPDDAVVVLGEAKKELSNAFGAPTLYANVDDHLVAALRASGRTTNSPGIAAEADALSKTESDRLNDQAVRLQKLGHYQEAIVVSKKAQQTAIEAGSEEAYLRATTQLACTDYALNDATGAYEQALKAVQKARSSDKISKKNKSIALAVLALTSADPHEAAKALQEASSISPNDALGELLAVSQMQSQRPLAAKVRECELIWSLSPKATAFHRSQALLVRFGVFNGTKNKGAAIAWFLEHAKSPLLKPDERMLCYQLAARLCQGDNMAQSQQILKQSLQLKVHTSDFPDTWDNAYRLAEDYTTLGRSKEAIAAAQHGLELLAQEPALTASLELPAHLTHLMAINYRAEHQYQKAMENFDKAIVLFRKGNLPSLQTVLTERAQLAAQTKH